MAVRSIGMPPLMAASASWSSITGKPSTFPSSPHIHSIGDVTGLQAALDSKLASASWGDVSGKPATFPPSAHVHPISEVTGLQSALDGKQPVGSYLTAVSWADVTGKPSTFPPSAHSHVIADVTGLQAALDGKQAAGSYAPLAHTHVIADVSGLQASLNTIPSPSSTTPLIAGTAAIGSSAAYARSDHVHPAQAMPAASSAVPLVASGAGAVGSSAAYARADHVHPLQSGSLTLLTTTSVGESALVTLGLSIRRYSVTVSGVTTTDRIVAVLNGIPSNGSLQDVYVSAANTISVGVIIPVLGVASTVALPIALYRVTP